MKKGYQLAMLMLLATDCLALAAFGAEQVDLTIYVHEGSLNGTTLSGVQITGQDAGGNSFKGLTNSNGAISVSGQPGTWKFTFERDGYDKLNLNYDVTETQEAAAYLTKAAQSDNQVALTVYVHEGDLNGTLLSGVKVIGQDAGGNSFSEITNSKGMAVINGQPGTWQFTFAKNGYGTLNLKYKVNETDEAAAYLEKNN